MRGASGRLGQTTARVRNTKLVRLGHAPLPAFSSGVVSPGDMGDYTVDDDNRLTSLVDSGVTTTFSYDKNGSTTSKTTSGTTTSYTYDGARRLTGVSVGGTSQASFAYDGNGARQSKTTASGTTTYVNDTRNLTQVLQETRPGPITLSYVPGFSQFDPSQTGNAQWAYFHADAQNNRALSDNAATAAKRWEYDPFGVIRSQSGSSSSDFQYAGEQKDSETGLINLRARYYDPLLGRFTQRDSEPGRAGFPQTYNRFTYSLNNPLRLVDPSGYAPRPQRVPRPFPEPEIDPDDNNTTNVEPRAANVLDEVDIGLEAILALLDDPTYQEALDASRPAIKQWFDNLWEKAEKLKDDGVALVQDRLDQLDKLRGRLFGDDKESTRSQAEQRALAGTPDPNYPAITNAHTVPQNALDTRDYIRSHGGAQRPGYKEGPYGNYEGRLPPARYHEYDVNLDLRTPEATSKGSQRLIIEQNGTNTGRVFYTNDHGETFTEVVDDPYNSKDP